MRHSGPHGAGSRGGAAEARALPLSGQARFFFGAASAAVTRWPFQPGGGRNLPDFSSRVPCLATSAARLPALRTVWMSKIELIAGSFLQVRGPRRYWRRPPTGRDRKSVV